MSTSPPLAFGVHRSDRDNSASSYGQFFWLVGLPDGREVPILADRMEVNSSGAVLLWSDTTSKGAAGSERSLRPEGPVPVLALPAGSWIHAYAASALDGSPVAIPDLCGPEEVTR